MTYLFPVDTQARNLSVKIREISTLKKGIVTKSNTRNDVTGAKRDLLDFRKVFFYCLV